MGGPSRRAKCWCCSYGYSRWRERVPDQRARSTENVRLFLAPRNRSVAAIYYTTVYNYMQDNSLAVGNSHWRWLNDIHISYVMTNVSCRPLIIIVSRCARWRRLGINMCTYSGLGSTQTTLQVDDTKFDLYLKFYFPFFQCVRTVVSLLHATCYVYNLRYLVWSSRIVMSCSLGEKAPANTDPSRALRGNNKRKKKNWKKVTRLFEGFR